MLSNPIVKNFLKDKASNKQEWRNFQVMKNENTVELNNVTSIDNNLIIKHSTIELTEKVRSRLILIEEKEKNNKGNSFQKLGLHKKLLSEDKYVNKFKFIEKNYKNFEKSININFIKDLLNKNNNNKFKRKEISKDINRNNKIYSRMNFTKNNHSMSQSFKTLYNKVGLKDDIDLIIINSIKKKKLIK